MRASANGWQIGPASGLSWHLASRRIAPGPLRGQENGLFACAPARRHSKPAAWVPWPVAPITAVYINGEGGWMSGDLEYEDVGPHHDRAMPIFAATPQRVRVRSLTIAESGLHGRHVQALLSSPHLTGLRHLDLCSNGLGRGSFGPLGGQGRRRARVPRRRHLPRRVRQRRGRRRGGRPGRLALPGRPDHPAPEVQRHRRGRRVGPGRLAAPRAPAPPRPVREPLGAAAQAALHGRFGSRVKL
jgi:hypothetical protein